MTPSSITRNDVVYDYNENTVNIHHTESKFPAFEKKRTSPFPFFKLLHITPTVGLKVYLLIHKAKYIIVNDRDICIEIYINSYDEAMQKARYWDEWYAQWTEEHEFKGLSRTQFIKDVTDGKLKAKLIFSPHGKNDNEFHPLVKRKGIGSVDIYRNNKYSSIFYIKDTAAVQTVYTGNHLHVYNPALRIYNETELKVLEEWEGMRDLQAEYVDAISDGSTEFWRKKHFFESKGCKHLMLQNHGLVRNELTRGYKMLSYEISRE